MRDRNICTNTQLKSVVLSVDWVGGMSCYFLNSDFSALLDVSAFVAFIHLTTICSISRGNFKRMTFVMQLPRA